MLCTLMLYDSVAIGRHLDHGSLVVWRRARTLSMSVLCTRSTAFISGEYGAVHSLLIPCFLHISVNSPLNCSLLSVTTTRSTPKVLIQCSWNASVMFMRRHPLMATALRNLDPSSSIVRMYLASSS